MESGRNTLPSIGVADTIGLVMSVVMPTFAKGVIIRRSRMVGLAEALGLDRKAVERVPGRHDAPVGKWWSPPAPWCWRASSADAKSSSIRLGASTVMNGCRGR